MGATKPVVVSTLLSGVQCWPKVSSLQGLKGDDRVGSGVHTPFVPKVNRPDQRCLNPAYVSWYPRDLKF